MPYVVIVHATFANKSDAEHIFNQSLAVATAASVARIGQTGERTSYAMVVEEQGDPEPKPVALLESWTVDRFGIVRRDDTQNPSARYPTWVRPTGAHDAYPAADVRGEPTRVVHWEQNWENTHGDGNIWEPGVFGWEPVEP